MVFRIARSDSWRGFIDVRGHSCTAELVCAYKLLYAAHSVCLLLNVNRRVTATALINYSIQVNMTNCIFNFLFLSLAVCSFLFSHRWLINYRRFTAHKS